MAPPSTRSAVGKEDPETPLNPNPELTLSEILAQIRNIWSEQTKLTTEIALLNDRIDKVGAIIIPIQTKRSRGQL
ncbi:hypothetical protein Golomagni_03315 [Golovinomyces magnicellulatus]|nr:hypothetical protein Golomagni_03315 [Golovinomyces magnicellulatus]